MIPRIAARRTESFHRIQKKEMTSGVHVYKIGPFEDGTSIYVPIGSEASLQLDPVEANDDVEGLRALAAQRAGLEFRCSP